MSKLVNNYITGRLTIIFSKKNFQLLVMDQNQQVFRNYYHLIKVTDILTLYCMSKRIYIRK